MNLNDIKINAEIRRLQKTNPKITICIYDNMELKVKNHTTVTTMRKQNRIFLGKYVFTLLYRTI